MKPVRMEELTAGEYAYRACLASLLELELEQIPRFLGMASGLQFQAWLASELNLARLILGGMEPPPILWVASLPSPYPGYDTHWVVMYERQVAFDPHLDPVRIVNVPAQVLECHVLVPLDPAQPSGRFAL